MNIFQKIKNLKYYCKILDEHKQDLYDKFNIKIDSIYRMYTVYNIDEKEYKTYGGDTPIIHEKKTIEEFLSNTSSSGKLMNGEEYFQLTVNKKISKLDQYLMSIGLSEMYGLSSKQKIDKLNIKVVIEFKYLNTLALANLALIGSISIISSVIIGTILAIFL